ncbi:hypothetical protein ACTFIY_008434 [Dictyostelium cf. discoideum]
MDNNCFKLLKTNGILMKLNKLVDKNETVEFLTSFLNELPWRKGWYKNLKLADQINDLIFQKFDCYKEVLDKVGKEKLEFIKSHFLKIPPIKNVDSISKQFLKSIIEYDAINYLKEGKSISYKTCPCRTCFIQNLIKEDELINKIIKPDIFTIEYIFNDGRITFEYLFNYFSSLPPKNVYLIKHQLKYLLEIDRLDLFISILEEIASNKSIENEYLGGFEIDFVKQLIRSNDYNKITTTLKSHPNVNFKILENFRGGSKDSHFFIQILKLAINCNRISDLNIPEIIKIATNYNDSILLNILSENGLNI